MTEYTPSTDLVRAQYQWNHTFHRHETTRGAEFDRWLAEVKAEERQIERDRLLALAKGDVRGCSGDDCEECDRMCLIEDLREITKDWVEGWQEQDAAYHRQGEEQ